MDAGSPRMWSRIIAPFDRPMSGPVGIGQGVAPQDLLQRAPVGDVGIRGPVAIDDDAQHLVDRLGVEPAIEFHRIDQRAVDVEHHQVDHAPPGLPVCAACIKLAPTARAHANFA
jgi:hypothetical protein